MGLTAPLQHDHVPVFATTTGPGWVQTVVLVGVLLAVGYALLGPFVPAMGRRIRLTVAVASGTAVLLMLVVNDRMELPSPVVAIAAVSLNAPLVSSARRTGPGRAAQALRCAAPVVVVGATALGGLLWWRSVVDVTVDPAVLLSTTLFVGSVGLVWLVLSDPRRPAARTAMHLVSWVLGVMTLAALAGVLVTTA